MLDNSLSNGVLFRHRRIASDDIDSMLAILANFWGAIQLTFPKAWDLPPNKSRLTHGAVIISMGLIMDAICDRLVNTPIPDEATFVEELRKLRPHCKWTEGEWDFGGEVRRKWNEIQNLPRDIEMLANHLVNCYRQSSPQ